MIDSYVSLDLETMGLELKKDSFWNRIQGAC